MMGDGYAEGWALEHGLQTLRTTSHTTTKVISAEFVLHEAIYKREFRDPLLKKAQDNINRKVEKVRDKMTDDVDTETLKNRFVVPKNQFSEVIDVQNN